MAGRHGNLPLRVGAAPFWTILNSSEPRRKHYSLRALRDGLPLRVGVPLSPLPSGGEGGGLEIYS